MSFSSWSRCLPELEDVAEVLVLAVVELAEHALQQHLREADHGVQRRAQLVRHAREELGLVLAGDLQLGGLGLELAEQLRVPHGERRLAREGLEELDGLVARSHPSSSGAPPARR